MDSGESKTNRKRLTMFGLASSAEAYTLRDFLQRSSVEFDWIELSSDDDVRRLAEVDHIVEQAGREAETKPHVQCVHQHHRQSRQRGVDRE